MTLSVSRASVMALIITLLFTPNVVQSGLQSTTNADYQCSMLDERGDVLFWDDFTHTPLGFNRSQWNLTTREYPSFIWQDNEFLETHFGNFESACLQSNIKFGPNVIAEFNFSSSQGMGYFSLGWCDNWTTSKEEWVFNSRLCKNGVFLDCWDSEVYLVTYRDGERSVAPLTEESLRQSRILTLIWTESLVQLYLDGELSASLSEAVPSTQMPLLLIASGHHYRSGVNYVQYHYVHVFERLRLPHPEDPIISLLWPSAGADVLSTDVIDFEVQGVLGPLQYSWDQAEFLDVYSPWDVPVPSDLGHHSLVVRASNGTSEWKYEELEFNVIEFEAVVRTYTMSAKPIIDGVLSSLERDQSESLILPFRNEHRDSIEVSAWMGFSGVNLYMAIQSPIEDTFHSRMCLLIDGDGDDIWNSTGLDLAVTLASPSAFQGYTGLSSPHSSQLIANASEGLIYQSAAEDGPVIAEFMIPLNRLMINETSGVSVGFRVLNEGQILQCPYETLDSSSRLLHISNAGVSPAIAMRNTSLLMIFLMTSSVIGIATYLSRREKFSVVQSLTDDQLERVKLLLFSHERIAVQRIARMIGTNLADAERIVAELLARGFPGVIHGEDVVRSTSITEKKEKGVSSPVV